MDSPASAVWDFDYPLIDDISISIPIGSGGGGGGDLAGLNGGLCWPAQGIDSSSNASTGNNSSVIFSEGLISQKRCSARTESCTGPSKACREKRRRDNLNDRFVELRSTLEPGNSSKMDKAAILSDAVRTVTELRSEAQILRESNESLQEKIKELKAEKTELRDEKQKLRAEKEKLELQVKMLSNQASFIPHPPAAIGAAAAPFGAHGYSAGPKLMMPMMGYPGFPMWHFMPPADVDTSHDAESCSPVA